MLRVAFFHFTLLLITGIGSAWATPLAEIRIRGSFAIDRPQLALELFRVLPEGDRENERKNGFIFCRSFGKGVTSWVECRIDMRNPAGRASLIGGMKFEKGDEGLVLSLTVENLESVKTLTKNRSELISCNVEEKWAICRLKWD